MSTLDNSKSDDKRGTTEAILLYGLFALVIGGGAGVWLPLLIPGKALAADGLATYVFAVLAPLLADAVLHEPYWSELSKTVRMRIVFGCGLAGVLALVALIRDGKDGDWTAGLLGVTLALIVWFFIAKFSHRFEPEPAVPPKGSLGGSVVSPDKLGGGGL
ncbi:hypothetical protein F8A86_09870 [Betaproteobacteria bacterium SCN1]|jgi:hypothetical protein|nr:hypothetical protein F8A86_09870 [Betaproteobacteria bacterium SCN1]